MFKIKGKEYNISLLKCYLPDESFKQLTFLREYFNIDHNADVIAATIKSTYDMALTHKDYLEKGEIKDYKDKSVPFNSISLEKEQADVKEDDSTDRVPKRSSKTRRKDT